MSSPHFVHRARCPGCDATASKTLFTCGLLESPLREHLASLYQSQGVFEPEYLEGATYRLVECAACGLYYQDEVPGEALSERLYERWIDPARTLADRRANLDLDTRLGAAREVLLASLHLRRGATPLRVLDFGMGWGDWCTMARAFGCDVWGLESSPARRAHARKLGIELVDWDELPARTFDFINCDQVLEHVTWPREVLARLAGSLAPEGLLKVSVPDGADLPRRLAKGDWSAPQGSPDSLLSVTPLQHVNCFRHENLVGMASREGLRPASLPLGIQLASGVDLLTPGKLVASLTRPLGRRLFTRDTYLYLERARGETPVQ